MTEQAALVRADERRNLIAAPVPISGQMPIAELAGHLVKAGYFKDVRDVSQAIVKVLYGQELGFPAISSMMGIHIIEGKPVCSATLMASMVKRSGQYDYRVVEMTDKRCEIAWFQRGEKVGTSAWTIEDAQRAGLTGKNNWKSYPRQMLFSRAVGEGVRTYFPDLFGGAPGYTDDESQDAAWETTATVGGGEVQVNRETGEVVPRPSAVAAQERRHARPTRGFLGGRPAPEAPPADPAPADLKSAMHAVKACLLSIGQSEEQAKAPWEYFGRILDRDNLKRTDLTLEDWLELHEQLRDARSVQVRMFAAWGGYRKAQKLAESDRYVCISDILGHTIETTSFLTPAQMNLLAQWFDEHLIAENHPAEAQQAVIEAEVVEENPFADVPEHPASGLAQS